jgi:hypothetical protein
MKKSIIFILITSLVILSCNKYSEAPRFSLLTAKSRLCDDWELVDYIVDGENFFDPSVTSTLSFDKDETYSQSNISQFLGQVQGIHSHGTWEFDDDKTHIIISDAEIVALPITFEIVELRSSSMKLTRNINGDPYTWVFETK